MRARCRSTGRSKSPARPRAPRRTALEHQHRTCDETHNKDTHTIELCHISPPLFANAVYHTASPCTLTGALERAHHTVGRSNTGAPRRHQSPGAGDLSSAAPTAITKQNTAIFTRSAMHINTSIFASLLHHGTTADRVIHGCPWDAVTHGVTTGPGPVMQQGAGPSVTQRAYGAVSSAGWSMERTCVPAQDKYMASMAPVCRIQSGA